MKNSNQPVTRKELAYIMGIHTKTLYRWLKEENINLKNRLISPVQKKMILRRFGYSSEVEFQLEEN